MGSKERSSPTRSRLRRLRRLLPSTLPSTDKSRVTLLEPRSVLMSMSKLLPRLRPDPVPLLLPLCKDDAEDWLGLIKIDYWLWTGLEKNIICLSHFPSNSLLNSYLINTILKVLTKISSYLSFFLSLKYIQLHAFH